MPVIANKAMPEDANIAKHVRYVDNVARSARNHSHTRCIAEILESIGGHPSHGRICTIHSFLYTMLITAPKRPQEDNERWEENTISEICTHMSCISLIGNILAL